MDSRLIKIIVILVLILIILGIIAYAYNRIRNKIRYYSRMLFGTSSIADGIRSMEKEAEITPKSVSSATNLYLPSIMRDFPEFHYDEMKTRAENVLISYLRSIDGRNSSLLTEGTAELREALKMKIQMLCREGQQEHFEGIRIHRTEINRYQKSGGRCSIVLQSAVEYIHYLEKDGKTVRGNHDRLEQSRYNIELVYIQDREVIENQTGAGMGLNCPNCGAPLTELGAKKCMYCDTPVVEFNIRVWNFAQVREA